jgi:hypothetical protein
VASNSEKLSPSFDVLAADAIQQRDQERLLAFLTSDRNALELWLE